MDPCVAGDGSHYVQPWRKICKDRPAAPSGWRCFRLCENSPISPERRDLVLLGNTVRNDAKGRSPPVVASRVRRFVKKQAGVGSIDAITDKTESLTIGRGRIPARAPACPCRKALHWRGAGCPALSSGVTCRVSPVRPRMRTGLPCSMGGPSPARTAFQRSPRTWT